MDTKEQYENIKKELKFLKEELYNLNVHCNERLTKIEVINDNLNPIKNIESKNEHVNISM